MEKKPPTETQENLRDAILNAATSLFVKFGYHGIGMREIAAASGASKALLYYHFQNKEDLFFAVLSKHLIALGELVTMAQIQNGNTREKIEFVFNGMAAWSQEQRAMIMLAKQEIKHLSESQRTAFMLEYHHHFIGQVQKILRDGIEAGELKNGDPVLFSQILLGMASPVLVPEWSNSNAQETMQKILTCFFDGAAAIMEDV